MADDDPLCPVDDERPPLSHERYLPEIDVLFLYSLYIFYLGVRIDVEDDEPYRNLHGGGKGETPDDALLLGILRIADLVLDELQRGRLVRVLYGEDAGENRLKPHAGPLFHGYVLLEEDFVQLN